MPNAFPNCCNASPGTFEIQMTLSTVRVERVACHRLMRGPRGLDVHNSC